MELLLILVPAVVIVLFVMIIGFYNVIGFNQKVQKRKSQGMLNDFSKSLAFAQNEIYLKNRKLDNMVSRLAVSNKKLAVLNNMKAKFFSMVVHDIRNPISAIIGFSNLAVRKAATEKQKRLCAQTIAAAKTVEHLSSDLTDIAMIEGGKFKVEKTSFNFSEIFKDFMPAIEITAGQKNVVLDYANIDADVEVLGDKFRLSQVLQNLLTNAIKFTSAKGAVKLNTRIAGKWLYVYIKDSGIGIHPTELKKVFERSYQAKHQKDKKLTKMGWGFGLSIAQEIILQHNGEIAVDSRGLGHGSTFWFKIPI